MEVLKVDELSGKINGVSKSFKLDRQSTGDSRQERPASPCLNRIMTQMGSLTPLNPVFTTTEQTGKPRGTGHPSKMKHNGLFTGLTLSLVWQSASGSR